MSNNIAGKIINVSSVAGPKVTPAGAVYAATKHAVRALSEGLRQEVGHSIGDLPQREPRQR